jgi:peptidoglycan hydrolase-like protein with peptidoglycan-binding domain
VGAHGSDVAQLHNALLQLGFQLPDSEIRRKFFGPATRQAVQQLQQAHGLTVSGQLDAHTSAAMTAELTVPDPQTLPSATTSIAGVVPVASPPAGGPTPGTEQAGAVPSRIQGQLTFDYGLPAAGITVRLYSVGFAGQDENIGETTSDDQGCYTFSPAAPPGQILNVQVRVVDSQNHEIPISATKYGAQNDEVLNLAVPGSVRPPLPEYQRLAADLGNQVNGVARLAQVKEDTDRQDLTLLSQSTGWDARLIALAATATQQTSPTGIGPDILYALYRAGMPTDPQHLAMVPSTTVQKALQTANQAGIIGLSDSEISGATASFNNFAAHARLELIAPGTVSNFGVLLGAAVPDATQRAAFADLYFSQPSTGATFWEEAANLQITAATLDNLKLQGKFLYLTFNNGPLTQKLQQEIGSVDRLSQLADQDFHDPAAWKTTLLALASSGQGKSLEQLIPPSYPGDSATDRLETYAADLARKVRFSFPTRTAARMIEKNELPLDRATAPAVTDFLRTATTRGYELGRTPLHAFLKSNNGSLPALDATGQRSLQTLHRLYQATPSTESLQACLKLGFTSAYDIASYTKDEFINRFAGAFPTSGEASLVYSKAQQISSVTFNFLTMAKHLDTSPPLYGLSPSGEDRQNAKNAIVEQFPTMASLFGSLDFCECEDCRSVLSPAAYFVDLLEFLRQSAPNGHGYTPLDVLLGKDATVPGRRPDLAALPLTCENTNTALPYIDLVNEILEYYIAHSGLDAGAAYDTGPAATDDLTAEPQHILPQVYSDTLKKAAYPRSLPLDLWIETVRGFLSYFKTSLAQLLDGLSPVDNLELFTDSNAYPYYRAQIWAESLGLSPVEYDLLTVTDPATQQPKVDSWYALYGYQDENTALNGQADPADASQYLVPPLKSAKNLSQRLGVTYQELTDLVTSGFLNPSLYALTFPFERFGISLGDAFSYTSQPGFPAMTATAKTAFETVLDGITQRYKSQNPASTFDARTWLTGLLPANYSGSLLVLRDPESGCDFTETTVQYADGTAATALDFLKLNLFVRLWKKLGWTLDETDRALQLFFPSSLPTWGSSGFAAAFRASWKTALVYLAHLHDLTTQLNPSLGRSGLLPLWADLPTQGTHSLYAQLFLIPNVLTGDPAFDDPAGQFPSATSDPLSAHQSAMQGALGLTSDDIAAILADAGPAVTTVTASVNGQNVTVPGFSLANLSTLYRYSALAKCLGASVPDLIAVKAMSGLNPLTPPTSAPLSALADDLLFSQALAFIKQVRAVQSSGFSVDDLKYLLRHQFDPVGQYRSDPNAMTALIQAMSGGLRQIQAQNAAPADLTSLSDDLIQQQLTGLFPAPVTQALFAVLTGSQSHTASQAGVATANQIDPAPFASELGLSFSYDPTTQTQSLTYQGTLLDWKRAELLQISNSPVLAALLTTAQQQAEAAFSQALEGALGVWASLARYEAVQAPVTAALPTGPLTQTDPGVSLSYDQAGQLQWLGYRGVLTDAKRAALTSANPSPVLASLLDDVQQQARPAFRELIGSLLATWANLQSYQAAQAVVDPADQLAPAMFAAYPEVQVSYDPTTKIQKLTYRGVLTDADRASLAGLVPASTVLASLLQSVRDQAVQFAQAQPANLVSISGPDLDQFVQPFTGIDAARKQRLAKGALIRVFLPLLARKLSRQLAVQTLAANLGADPSLTESMMTDAGLLSDPNHPGKSLLESFLAIGQQGVTVAYYASPDGSGPPLATGTASTTDTSDPTNPNTGGAGTGSVHFEGYLQVPSDGPYRFFAELGNQNATVSLVIDPPEPTALLPDPLLPVVPGQAATKDDDELSQFIQLKGGVAYHFTLDFSSLGAKGASLAIQGETLPKGPLSQVVLYPQDAVDSFARARMLLSKVLQILRTFALDERELSYLTANAAQFSNLTLSDLPTRPADDSPAQAAKLFAQFLTLADYADLRKRPGGGSDGLIGVFANVGQAFTEPATSPDSNQDPATPWNRLASLTRRDPGIVRDVALALNLIQEQTTGASRQVTAVGDFGNNRGIRRIWQALQLVQVVGIPVSTLVASTAVVAAIPTAGALPPEVIATTLTNAVKARFSPAAWRPVAKSVFDKLRQRRRDALVAYLVNALALESSNQLFEYFLVDPGMEPVVQTSRLRLALSSVQTFIQRCLLNLENGNSEHPERNVVPAAIRADWWEWMKRYRVWQANREIFLFPENWLEPELRLDKSDLFQTLESALLQGDVTRDLVEDGFFSYLQGLEQRARLQFVAMYLDQDANKPELSILHVIARTYGQPHQYFYRTYANQSWSAWEAVTPSITGNQIVAVVWRGRLNLFWVTFFKKGQANPIQSSSDGSTNLGSLPFDHLTGAINNSRAQPQVQAQLHWSEYFQGKWSKEVTTEIDQFPVINVDDYFDPDYGNHIHVSKEVDANGNEGAVRIHLFLRAHHQTFGFRLTSRNSDPDFGHQYWQADQPIPYIVNQSRATLFNGSSTLQASFETQIANDGSSSFDTEPILDTVHDFALLTCGNPVVPPFLDPSEPLYQEAGGLVSPFFYMDTSSDQTTDELAFFVQPSLTEKTIIDWEGWAIPYATPNLAFADPNTLNKLKIVAQMPTVRSGPVNPPDPAYSVYGVLSRTDWVTHPSTAISYGNTWIAKAGGINLGKIVATGGSITRGTGTAVLGTGTGPGRAGQAPPVGGLTLVGARGLGLSQLQAISGPPIASAVTNAVTAAQDLGR